MFLDGVPVRFPRPLDIVEAVVAALAFNGFLALRVARDARRRNIPSGTGRLFAVVTLLTSFLGIAAYMAYEIVSRPKRIPAETPRPKEAGIIVHVIEIVLAAIIIGFFYFFVRRIILMDVSL